jgi:hypothetical protein
MESKPINLLSNRFKDWRWLCGACSLLLIAGNARAQEYDPDWTRNFRVGMLVGFNIKTDFKMTSGTLVKPKNGIFDDGYVIPDPNNTADDYTSNWGYNDASQFDGASTLTMHRTDSFTPTGVAGGAANDTTHFGFDMEYGDYLWRWDRLRLGWNLGFGLLPIEVSEGNTFNATLGRSIFTFDTGPHALFPPAGYQGNPGGEGPNIHSTPLTGPDPETPGAEVPVTGSRKLDVTLFTLRLGPSLFYDLNDYVGLAVGAGPAVGFVTGNYKFNESIDTGGGGVPNRGSFGADEFVFGGYANATITFHAVANGDFYLSAQYMPLGTTSFSEGGREAKLDLSGALYVSAGINWPF